MTEQILVLEQADPVLFCGINNTNILLLKNLYPKIRIIARGNTVKAVGEEGDSACLRLRSKVAT